MAQKEIVLIVVDPTADDHPATRRGMWLAEQRGMAVDLFICDYSSSLVGDLLLSRSRLKLAKKTFLETKRAMLDELAEPYRSRGIEVATKVAWDRPLHEGIVRQALRSNARYVVKDTHHHSTLARTLFTNTDWHLIRSCPVPLWLVKQENDFEQPRIMVAVDPFHVHDKPAALDVRLLSEAFELAADVEGQVEVAHVFNPYEEPEDPAEQEEEHLNALLALAEPLQVDPARLHLEAGSPVDVLPALALDMDISVTVMGSVARSRLSDAIVGSTAENILDRLESDVLVLKPSGFISSVTFECAPDEAALAE